MKKYTLNFITEDGDVFTEQREEKELWDVYLYCRKRIDPLQALHNVTIEKYEICQINE